MINPKTLQPSKRAWEIKYYYFCNEEHREKWLTSPLDDCMMCHKKLKTEAPINKYIQKDNLDWWICNVCILKDGGVKKYGGKEK